MPDQERLSEYDGQINLLLNPVSTGYRRIVKQSIGELLIEYGKRVNVLHTSPKEAETQDIIIDNLHEGDILVSAGGDGSDRIGVRTLIDHPDLSEPLRQTPFISWFGGNANQGPAELYHRGLFGTPSLVDVIKQGRVINIHPLLASMLADTVEIDQTTEEPIDYPDMLALYFVGAGGTGNGTAELEKVRGHDWRSNVLGRNLIDTKAAVRGVLGSPHFLARETRFDENGQIEYQSDQEEVYEASIINGERMAKVGRFPSRLHEDEFFRIILSDNRIHSVIKDGVKMRFARLPGVMIDGQKTVQFDFETINEGDEIWAHFDGDPHRIPQKGSLSVKQHPKTYRAGTTNFTTEY